MVWLLMLAVPAQGFAAATMLFCGPMHERMSATADAHGSAHQHGSDADSHREHHAAPSDVAADVVSADAAADLGKIGELAKVSCSACAACSVGVAMVASNGNLPLAELAIERIASTSLPYIGFVTGGPQRPPRSFLA